MVSAIAADEAHAILFFVNDHAIAVYLFLVYPAVVVKRARE